MSSNPSISRRRWIRSPPSNPIEPTSTIVLTSPKRTFVDIRLLNSEQHNTSSSLSWAFAGTSHVKPATPSSPAQGNWDHWLDSKIPLTSTAPPDSGSLHSYPSDDGTELELECGKSLNEDSGNVEEYEELWEVVKARGADGQRSCIVLKTRDEDDQEVRGTVVRVGEFVQGVLKTKNGDLTVVRWMEKDGEWRVEAEIGNGSVPCGVAVEIEERQVGQEISARGVMWRIEEIVKW